jgi:hypothetical protein
MPDQPAKPLRRFRFSLRTLLVFVALCTVASWAYWIGWPWWQMYRFESALRHLRAGASTYDVMQLGRPSRGTQYQGGYNGNAYGMTTFVVPSGLYCVYFTYVNPNGGMLQRPCNTVSVYHLPPVPADYQPNGVNDKQDRVDEFASEFMNFISNRTPPKFPYKYELIHIDPPDAR